VSDIHQNRWNFASPCWKWSPRQAYQPCLVDWSCPKTFQSCNGWWRDGRERLGGSLRSSGRMYAPLTALPPRQQAKATDLNRYTYQTPPFSSITNHRIGATDRDGANGLSLSSTLDRVKSPCMQRTLARSMSLLFSVIGRSMTRGETVRRGWSLFTELVLWSMLVVAILVCTM